MGLLIVRGLAALFRCSGARFRDAMDSPAFNDHAKPAHHPVARARGGHVQPHHVRSLPLPLGCGGSRSGY
jgi:hypothetical protein